MPRLIIVLDCPGEPLDASSNLIDPRHFAEVLLDEDVHRSGILLVSAHWSDPDTPEEPTHGT